jgi:hypothetical protein
MEAWDDESVDVDRTMNRIITGVMHHPAQREMGEDGARDCRQIMIQSVDEWWNGLGEQGKDEYRRKLSRDGVLNGKNHREGVHDTGHGCGKPLGMNKKFSGGDSMEDRIASGAADAIIGGLTGGISNIVQSETGIHLPTSGGGGGSSYGGRQESFEEGGLGGIINSVGGALLGGFNKEEKQSYSSRRQDENSYTESRTEYGQSEGRYGQADYSRTQYSGGGESESYRRYEQDEDRRGNTTSYEERTETRYGQAGGYEERREERYESHQESYGGGRRDDEYDRRDDNYGRRDDDYGRRDDNYGRRDDDYGRRDDDFGRRDEGRFGGGGGGGGGFGGPPPPREDFGGGGGYGRPPPRNDDYGRRDEGYGGRRDEERRDEGEELVEGVLDMAGRAFGGGRRDDDGERRGGWGF